MATGDKARTEFMVFYKAYHTACLNRDAAFLKSILPVGVPDDEFAFVLDMSQASAQAVETSGITPRVELAGDRCNVIYTGDLGDDMTELNLDFYRSPDGRWLKYDPGAQG
jgi:hypothetical protein